MDEIIAKYDSKVVSYVEMMKARYDYETGDFTDSDYELHLYSELQNEAEEDLGITAEEFGEIWCALEDTDSAK